LKEVHLTIDGKKTTVEAGSTILEAARSVGIEIPNLCYDPRIGPIGSCRLCVVEIKGRAGLVISCATPATDGMEVFTETAEIAAVRRTILELMLSEHRLACASCDVLGDCKLQQYAYRYNVNEGRYGQAVRKPPRSNYTTGNEAIIYDPDKCIRCGRCIQICEQVQAVSALTFRGRGAEIEVSTAFDVPLNQSVCELCGNCISTCPTGALYERSAKGQGQAKDLTKVRTTCPYCGVGCQIDLNVNPKTNRIVRVTSQTGVIPNNGNLCVKGRFAYDFVSDQARLTQPLVKRNGRFVKTSWDKALTLVAERLNIAKRQSGPDSIAGLASAKCTNEDNYIFQKFMRACVGTNNVDHCARLCHASTVAGLARAFGSGAMTNSIDELRGAKCIFVIGSNTTEAHPVIGLVIKEAVVRNGAQLIVADPRDIDLVRFAKLHLRQKPGTDVALINAMMNVIIAEGLLDRQFIEQRTENFEQFQAVIGDYTPEKVQAVTSVPGDLIRQAAVMYARAGTSSIVYSMGITQHTTGTDNVLALANLAMLTGNVGFESTGVNPLRGQNNVQGACDLGALPNVLPGYQPVDDAQLRGKFEQAWGAKLPARPGLTVVEMMHAIEEGKIKALYVMGENPALSDPNLNRTRRALETVDFLVVQDIFLSETAQYADVVLPSFCFAEKDGTFTNTERRVQRVRKAVKPPAGARDDWRILCAVAAKMGYPMKYRGPKAIMNEIASLTPIYGGIAYNRIEKVGLQWPCPDKNHPGTRYLHAGAFKRGRGKFHPVQYKPASETTDEQYPFLLSTGRQLYQFHTGTLTRKSNAINQVSPTGYIEINPDDAQRLGIAAGESVEVSTKRGTVVTEARVTTEVAKGWLFMPFHFAEGAANILTTDALDPVAKIPEYKVCAANVRRRNGGA